MDEFKNMNEVHAFEQTLREMGINPANIGKKGADLPPIPGSDPTSLNRNLYNGFYQYGAKEFWDQSEISATQIEDFKKCQHYLTKRNNEAYCTKCHVGWIVNDSFQVVDGKLHDGHKFLEFAV